MANSNFRSDRSRDPLAELARLIGQTDPYADSEQRQSHHSERSAAPLADLDWAAEQSYARRDGDVDERYAEPAAPAPASHSSHAPQRAYEQQHGYAPEHVYEQEPRYEDDHGYENEHGYEAEQGYEQEQAYAEEQSHENEAPAGGRYFSGPAGRFSGFRDEPGPHEFEERPQLPSAGQLHQERQQTYAAAPDHGYETDDPQQDDDADDAYAVDDYDDEEAPSPRRRSGLVIVMAIFGLAVIGTGGAFAYRAMFGGSVLPSLPPIIKASLGPNRVAPAYGEGQADNGGDPQQTAAATTGSTENLVSREEQPVTIEPPRVAPRVVSTIPVSGPSTGQGMPPGLTGPAPGQPTPGRMASAADPAWPAPPQMAAPVPPPAAAPMPSASSEPRKIHTVTIRSDQSGGGDAGASAGGPAPAAARPQSRSATQRTSAPNAPQPMSIVPGQDGAPVPQHTRTAAASVASTGSVAAAAPATSGGFLVQVSSNRSEEEAQSAFRTLEAKYPDQLSGREPIIRRVELAEKGTYFRALVGPFASLDEAAGLCSGIKAAGGSCIVQRN